MSDIETVIREESRGASITLKYVQLLEHLEFFMRKLPNIMRIIARNTLDRRRVAAVHALESLPANVSREIMMRARLGLGTMTGTNKTYFDTTRTVQTIRDAAKVYMDLHPYLDIRVRSRQLRMKLDKHHVNSFPESLYLGGKLVDIQFKFKDSLQGQAYVPIKMFLLIKNRKMYQISVTFGYLVARNQDFRDILDGRRLWRVPRPVKDVAFNDIHIPQGHRGKLEQAYEIFHRGGMTWWKDMITKTNTDLPKSVSNTNARYPNHTRGQIRGMAYDIAIDNILRAVPKETGRTTRLTSRGRKRKRSKAMNTTNTTNSPSRPKTKRRR